MLEFAESADGLVHLVHPIGGEYTLCGDAEEGNPGIDSFGDVSFAWKLTQKREVTCSKCLAIIQYCKLASAKKGAKATRRASLKPPE